MVAPPRIRRRRNSTNGPAYQFPPPKPQADGGPAAPVTPSTGQAFQFIEPGVPPSSGPYNFVKKQVAREESGGIADRLEGGPGRGKLNRNRAGMFQGGVGLYQFDVNAGTFGRYLQTIDMGGLGFDAKRSSQLQSGKLLRDAELDRVRGFMKTPEGIESQDRFFENNIYKEAEKELNDLGMTVDQGSLLYMTDMLTHRGRTNYETKIKPHFSGGTIQDLVLAEMASLEKGGSFMNGDGAAIIAARRLRTADLGNLGVDPAVFEDLFNMHDDSRRAQGRPSHNSVALGRKKLNEIRAVNRDARKIDSMSTLGDQP